MAASLGIALMICPETRWSCSLWRLQWYLAPTHLQPCIVISKCGVIDRHVAAGKSDSGLWSDLEDLQPSSNLDTPRPLGLGGQSSGSFLTCSENLLAQQHWRGDKHPRQV